jgi:hypothetical protein
MENIPFRSLHDAGKDTLVFEGILASATPVRLEGVRVAWID